MMHYYINKKKRYTGEYEMHCGSCYRLPKEEERILIGSFNDFEAINKAKEKFDNVDGCFYCCNTYHKNNRKYKEKLWETSLFLKFISSEKVLLHFLKKGYCKFYLYKYILNFRKKTGTHFF